jgi:diguanylate cyclase
LTTDQGVTLILADFVAAVPGGHEDCVGFPVLGSAEGTAVYQGNLDVDVDDATATRPALEAVIKDRRSRRTEGWQVPAKVFWVYGCLGLLLAAYVVSLLVRGPNQQWLWLDNWATAAFEVIAALLCLVKGLVSRSGRAVPIFLGLAVLSWGFGDLAFSAESVGGNQVSTPSASDPFWLCFYPLAYIGAVLLIRRSLGRLARPNWLDAGVASLGAAAVCATFVFHDIVRATGQGGLATVVNLAYPIGDLLLLSMIVGGSALLVGSRRTQWYVLAGAFTVNIVGDTFALFVGNHPSHVGVAFNDAAWPASILLISLSVWLRSTDPDLFQTPRAAGFLLPGVGALAGFAVLVTGTLHRLGNVALGLAIATLAAVGARLAISTRTLRALTEQNHRHAITDELTGLGNRRRLFAILDGWFASRSEDATIAFLFIDLNHFKEINDSFGHPAGDQLLAELGPRLTGAVRSSDLVVRLGGDEFAVVLLDSDVDEAAAVAQRVIEVLELPFRLQAMSATIGASIGVALAPQDAADATGLVWSADVAMYRAKLGQTHVVFYDPEIDGGESQLNLADDLLTAVTEGHFVLHYQPQLDLQSGRLIGFEALIRWPHPTLGLIPPMKFLPLAEDANLMKALTEWVLDTALAECAIWLAAGAAWSVSVNISPSNLLDPSLPGMVSDHLSRHGVPPEALVLEITETSVIADFEGCRKAIERLKSLGIAVSIDDFGAGFTSLAHLSNLAVGELKLDRVFVSGLADRHRSRDLELVRATIELGHAIGLRVVAEGVEDGATLELLRGLGCEVAQGYYIGMPTPPEKLALPTKTPTLTA